MKKVKITLLGMLLIAIISCKKAEKIGTEIPTNRIVSTLAGAGAAEFADGQGERAAFNNPQKIAIDASGNMYVADQSNNRIRKITHEGIVTTLAGNGQRGYVDGPGATAQFNRPTGIAIDANGNVYIADSGNSCIRRITSSGVVSTFAGLGGSSGFANGTGTEARFNYPFGLAVDASNNIFVADINDHRIRKITPAGVVTTFAGNGQSGHLDGPIETATVSTPAAIAFDPSGNMYVAQSSFVRKITPQGMVSVFAGFPEDYRGIGYVDGVGFVARFFYIYDLTTDKKGNIYIADSDNNLIRKISSDGIVSTYAGSQYIIADKVKYKDGLANEAYFARPQGIVVDKDENVIVTENDNHRIRKISEVPVPDSPDEIARKNWNNPQGWK